MFNGIVRDLSTYSVFESIRAYRGKVFELELHLRRFYESAQTIMLKIPQNKEELKKRIFRTLKASGLKDAYIRIAALGENKQTARIGIVVKQIKPYPQDFYRKGIRVVVVAVKRNSINALTPNIKSANFLSGVLAKIEANGQKVFEGLLLNPKGYVTEGTVSNIFIVKGKNLLTPKLSCGALGGITRRVVIDLAENFLGIKTEETLISRYDIYTASEAFLTNTSIEIMPVVSCDGRLIGNGKPGAVTKRLIAEFKKRRSERWQK